MKKARMSTNTHWTCSFIQNILVYSGKNLCISLNGCMYYLCFATAPLLFYNAVVNINTCTNVEEETYSLSIRIGDIEVPPPSLWARSGRLAAHSFKTQREIKQRKKEGRKKRRWREIWAPWCVSDRGRPRSQTPGSQGGAAETLSPAAQPETTLHAVTMVIIRWNHRDYNSSGIVCETNMDALDTHIQGNSQKERGV